MYRLEEHGNSSKRDITFKQLHEIINQNGTSDRKLNALLTKSKLNATLSNRAEEDFIKYIDTTKIVEINIEGKSTYSMRIKTNIEEGVNFYNLLVYEKNEELKQIIIKYMPDATFNPQIPEDFKGTIVSLDEEGNPKDIEVFEYNKELFVICGMDFIQVCLCPQGYSHCGGESEDVCNGGGQVIGFYFEPILCANDGGGSQSDGGSVGASSNTNGHLNLGAGGSGLSTIAVYFSPADIRKKDFVRDELTSVEREWLFNPLNDAHEQSIYAFLEQSLTDENGFVSTNYSTANINFVKEIILRMKLNPEIFTSITPFLIEKNIDDTLLDPCSKNVFLQIKNTTNCDFANVLAKLGVDTSVYKTAIKTEHNNDENGNLIGDPANTIRTTQGVKYNYTIYINPDYTGKTKLFITALQLHELAHAYFFSLLDDYNSDATNAFYELPILYNAFQTHSSNFNAALTHEEIANSYVSAISAALQEYQPGLEQQVYDDMAWGGLIGTPIFDTLFPAGNPNLERIMNRYECEQTGNPSGQGTPSQQNPMGQPCN